jgi:hypothetical protein
MIGLAITQFGPSSCPRSILRRQSLTSADAAISRTVVTPLRA